MKNLKQVTDFIVKLALAEDVGAGDITTKALIPPDCRAKAIIKAKAKGVIAGLFVAKDVFRHVDPRIRFTAKVKDGQAITKGQIIAEISGPARGILTGERVALNFLQHLSGIATLTKAYKLKTQNAKIKSNVKILDTRKTTPGLRLLEKYAVKVGGGTNHRMGLDDAILVKDNHLKLIGGIGKAIEKIKGIKREKGIKETRGIEVEAKTMAEVKAAIKGGAKRVLLDNMGLRTLRQAVKICRQAGIKTEASGGVNLDNVKAIAKTGVDHISIGALTHSAPALDISLKIV